MELPIKPCNSQDLFDSVRLFFAEVPTESARGIALSGGALIESHIKTIWWNYVREPKVSKTKLKEYQNVFMGARGISSSFSACSYLCFGMNIIQQRELDILLSLIHISEPTRPY